MGYRSGVGLATAVMVALVSFVAAPAAQAATPTVGQYEARIAELVNEARADAGLPAVTVSATMSTVARSWSGTMARTGNFAHNPSYSSQLPAGWTRLGENVAYGMKSPGLYEALQIHKNLMGSPGHRANILNPSYTHVGIGVAYVNRSGRTYVYVTQNFGTYPGGVAADRPVVAADVPFRQIVMSPDTTGDGLGDIYSVDSSGRLFLYRGTRGTPLGSPVSFGTGWGALDVFAPGDITGDGRADLVATDSAGRLWLYPGRGGGALGSRQQIGNGWTGYRLIPTGDMNGDRRADLLAIDRAGRLWLYPGRGAGRFGKAIQVGNGWTGYELHAAGDMNRDGRRDIFGVDSGGRLWLYPGRGGGTFSKRIRSGQGWTGYDFSSGADMNGDGVADLLGKGPDRRLWFYAGRTGGSFSKAVQIGSGW